MDEQYAVWHGVEKFRVEKSGVEMSFKLLESEHFNPGLLRLGIQSTTLNIDQKNQFFYTSYQNYKQVLFWTLQNKWLLRIFAGDSWYIRRRPLKLKNLPIAFEVTE